MGTYLTVRAALVSNKHAPTGISGRNIQMFLSSIILFPQPQPQKQTMSFLPQFAVYCEGNLPRIYSKRGVRPLWETLLAKYYFVP